MPASPSFPSDTRKWKRRKREPRKQLNKHDEDDVAVDEDEEQYNNETDTNMDRRQNGDDFYHGTAPDPALTESEVLIDGGTRICEFSKVVQRVVNWPHMSVMDIVAIERANLAGDGSGRSLVVVLENISYGQLQALSAVPADSVALDPEMSDTSCVIAPPQIMEGKGVVKPFGSRVHVVPIHSDFIRVDPAREYGDIDGETWSDRESFLLLEGIEIYNDDWNEIAEHVGTKSKAQCILHLVRLPMEVGLLENVEVPNTSRTSNSSCRDDCGGLHSTVNRNLPGSGLQEADLENRLLFANSGNPVMALVSFLASAVGPIVAAAYAHASLAALSGQMEGAGHGNRMNSENVRNIKEENSGVHGSWGQNGAEAAPLSAEKVKAAAKAGLAAAATKAKLFADHDDREIQRLTAIIIYHQLKRLELKLK